MNPFSEKSDKELQAYFSDYEQLRSFDRDCPISDPEFARLLAEYKNKCGGEGVQHHDSNDAVPAKHPRSRCPERRIRRGK